MKNIPPRWADRLLEKFVAPHLLEDVQGDLHEVFYKQVHEVGPTKARRAFSLAVLHYLNPFFLKRKPTTYLQTSFLHPAMLRNYLLIAFRTLAHNQVYSAVNVVGLSIGLMAAMLIMLYTKDEASYDRFHQNNPNIYRITSKSFAPAGNLDFQQPYTGIFQGPKFTAGTPEIKAFTRYAEDRKDLKQGTEVVSQPVYLADPDFFSIFSFPLLAGNPKTALRQPKSVVISADMAEKNFGTTDALGKTLYFKTNDQFEPYNITGVVVKAPQNSSIKFDVMMPISIPKEDWARNDNWFSVWLNTFVLVNPKADLRLVESKMNRIYQADAKKSMKTMAEKYGDKNKVEYALQPFTDMHLNTQLNASNGLVDNSNPVFSYILSGIALFILLIACINFVNLTVARSLKRAKEIGVRKVVGGGRTQLLIQFLGESFILCLIAFTLAVLLVQLVLPVFNQLANKALALSYLFDARLVVGYIMLLVVTGLLAGFYPALILSGYSPVQTLYSRFAFSNKNYLQKTLVVVQFSLASFLIIATLTVSSQFTYLTTKSLGYNDKDLIVLTKPNMSRDEAKLVKEEMTKNPNIVTVAPKNGGFWLTIGKVNRSEKQLNFAYETVDDAYIPMLNVPIVKGRNFSTDFPADSTQSVLVNETFVKEAGWKNPIGQVVDFSFEQPEKYMVIGVVKDYHYQPLNQEIKSQLFTMKPKNKFGTVFVKIKPHTETASLQYIASTFKKLFPTTPYTYKFLDEENRKKYESEEKWKQIMLFGAVLTIFISCIGLFGLATLSAERRTKEIGIRKVLGASVTGIVQLLSANFLKLVGCSFIFAFPAAWYAVDKWLQNYPYRVNISVWTFVTAACLAVLVAFLTISFQSIKAALTNPVKSLRSE